MDRIITRAARLPLSACAYVAFPARRTGSSMATRGFPGR